MTCSTCGQNLGEKRFGKMVMRRALKKKEKKAPTVFATLEMSLTARFNRVTKTESYDLHVETGLTKNQAIAELAKSTHGDLQPYVTLAVTLGREDPDFLAHLIAWNEINGHVRDSKVGLPMASLLNNDFAKMEEPAENSYAHLAKLDPREFLRAIRFSRALRIGGSRQKKLYKLNELYLREREGHTKWWDSCTVQHRRSMKSLYAMHRLAPSGRADSILFKRKYPKGSVFEAIKRLKDMPPKEAAIAIMGWDIPTQIAEGALGAKAKDPDLVLALMEQMSPNQLINNMVNLERMGVKTNPALRAALEAGLAKVATSKKAPTFKTSKAIEAFGDTGSSSIKEKLQAVQEKQIETLGTVDGNWLVTGDKSGSMEMSIEASRFIAGTLARMVKGEVHLTFVDESPRYFKATGKTLDEIQRESNNVYAGGGTCLGCGLQYILDKGILVDGITIVSDGGENRPPYFHDVYAKYVKKFDHEPTIYFYKLRGSDPDRLTGRLDAAGIDAQTFDLTAGNVDYYSLPNLVKTMNTKRYRLVDQILDTPLLTVKSVIKENGVYWE